MPKIEIDAPLFDRVKAAVTGWGYSSIEEFVANAIQGELTRLGMEEAEQQVADQLRGLGYIE